MTTISTPLCVMNKIYDFENKVFVNQITNSIVFDQFNQVEMETFYNRSFVVPSHDKLLNPKRSINQVFKQEPGCVYDFKDEVIEPQLRRHRNTTINHRWSKPARQGRCGSASFLKPGCGANTFEDKWGNFKWERRETTQDNWIRYHSGDFEIEGIFDVFRKFMNVCDSVDEAIPSIVEAAGSISNTSNSVAGMIEALTGFLKEKNASSIVVKMTEVLCLLYDFYNIISTQAWSFVATWTMRLISCLEVPALVGSKVSSWIQRLIHPTEVRQGAEEFAVQGNCVASLPAALVGLVGVILTGCLPSDKQISKVTALVRMFATITPTLDSVSTWIVQLTSILPKCVSEWIKEICPAQWWLSAFEENAPFHNFVTEAYEVHSLGEEFKMKCSYDPMVQQRVKMLHRTGTELLHQATELPKVNSKVMGIIRDAYKIVDDLYRTVDLAAGSSGSRFTPFCICFTGKPGTGKSHIMSKVATKLAPLGQSPGNLIYTRNMNPYWDGYTGQFACFFDDIGQRTSSGTNDEWGEFIDCKGGNPYCPPRAAIPDKGTPFSSKLILCSTNNSHPRPATISSHSAIWRRRDLLIEVIVKDEFLTDGVLDLDLMPNDNSHLVFRLQNPMIAGQYINVVHYSYDQIMGLILNKWRSWCVKQERSLADKRRDVELYSERSERLLEANRQERDAYQLLIDDLDDVPQPNMQIEGGATARYSWSLSDSQRARSHLLDRSELNQGIGIIERFREIFVKMEDVRTYGDDFDLNEWYVVMNSLVNSIVDRDFCCKKRQLIHSLVHIETNLPISKPQCNSAYQQFAKCVIEDYVSSYCMSSLFDQCSKCHQDDDEDMYSFEDFRDVYKIPSKPIDLSPPFVQYFSRDPLQEDEDSSEDDEDDVLMLDSDFEIEGLEEDFLRLSVASEKASFLPKRLDDMFASIRGCFSLLVSSWLDKNPRIATIVSYMPIILGALAIVGAGYGFQKNREVKKLKQDLDIVRFWHGREVVDYTIAFSTDALNKKEMVLPRKTDGTLMDSMEYFNLMMYAPTLEIQGKKHFVYQNSAFVDMSDPDAGKFFLKENYDWLPENVTVVVRYNSTEPGFESWLDAYKNSDVYSVITTQGNAYSSGDIRMKKLNIVRAEGNAYQNDPQRKRLNVVRAEGKDTQADQLVNNRIIPYLGLFSPVGGRSVNCLRVFGKCVLVPAHAFYDESGTMIAEDSEIIVQLEGDVKFRFRFNKQHMYRISQKDFCVYFCGATTPSCRDNIGHFISEKDLAHHGKFEAQLITRIEYVDGKIGHVKAQTTRVASLAQASYPLGSNPNAERILMQNGWTYSAHTEKGYCGSPLVANDSHMVRKIVGFHVGSYTHGDICQAELVTQEMLLKAKENLPFSPDGIPCPKNVVAENDVAGCSTIPEGNFSLHGRVKPQYAVRQPDKADLKPSPIYEMIFPHSKEPSAINPRDQRILNLTKSIVGKGVNKYGSYPPIPLETELLNRAIEDIAQEIRNLPHQNFPRRMLTESEGINGIPEISHMDALNMQTSPGFPYRLQHRNEKGKTYLFSGGPGAWAVDDPQLRFELDQRDAMMMCGKRPPSVWMDCVKLELRPVLKIQQANTRVFCISNLPFLIYCRRLMLAFNACVETNALECASAIGIDPFSYQWTRIMNTLLANSPYGFAGDFGKYDSTLRPEVIMGACKVMNTWYAVEDEVWIDEAPDCVYDEEGYCIKKNCVYRQTYSVETENTIRHGFCTPDELRENLFDEMIHTMSIVNNCLYVKHCGNPSGCPITSILNTLCNMIYMRYMWFALAPKEMQSSVHFHKNVVLFVYGDDNIVSVTPIALEFFNMVTLSKKFAEYGLEYTTTTKDDVIIPFVNVVTLDFLKQGFAQFGRFYLPTMDKATIQELTNWIRESDDDFEACVNNCNDSLKFAFAYGRDYFEALRRKMYSALISVSNGVAFNLFDWSFFVGVLYDKGVVIPPECCVWSDKKFDLLAHSILCNYPPYVEHVRSPVAVKTEASAEVKPVVVIPKSDQAVQALGVSNSQHPQTQNMENYKQNYVEFIEKACECGKCVTCAQSATFQIEGLEQASVSGSSGAGDVHSSVGITALQQSVVQEQQASRGMSSTPHKLGNQHLQDTHWDLEKMVMRSTYVGTYGWTTTQGVLDEFMSLQLPKDVLTSGLNSAPFKSFTYFKGDIKLRFELNATPFHVGKVLVYYVPLTSDYAIKSWHGSNLSAATTVQHVYLDASSSTVAEMTIPFANVQSHIACNGESHNARNFQYMGYVKAMVFNPLLASTDASTTVNVTVYAEMVNVEFKLPQYDQVPLSGFEIQGFVRDPMPVMAQTGDEEDFTPLVITKTKSHNLSEFRGSKRDEMDMKFLTTFPTFFATVLWSGSDNVGESLFNDFIAPCTQLYGAPITESGLTPAQMFGAPTTTQRALNVPLSDYVTMPYTFWQGGIRYRIMITASKFQTGKLFISANYLVNTAALPDALSPAQKRSQYGMVFDLGDQSHDVTVDAPYIHPLDWMYVPNGPNIINNGEQTSVGKFSISVLNPLTSPSNVPGSVYINIFKSGADDYAVSTPASRNCSWSPKKYYDTNPALEFEIQGAPGPAASAEEPKQEQETAQIPIEVTLAPEPNRVSDVQFGNVSRSILQDMMSFTPLTTINFKPNDNTSTAKYGTIPTISSSTTIPVTIPTSDMVYHYSSTSKNRGLGTRGLLGWFGSMYRLWRGDMDYHIVFDGVNNLSTSNVRPYVSFDPNIRDLTTINAFNISSTAAISAFSYMDKFNSTTSIFNSTDAAGNVASILNPTTVVTGTTYQLANTRGSSLPMELSDVNAPFKRVRAPFMSPYQACFTPFDTNLTARTIIYSSGGLTVGITGLPPADTASSYAQAQLWMRPSKDFFYSLLLGPPSIVGNYIEVSTTGSIARYPMFPDTYIPYVVPPTFEIEGKSCDDTYDFDLNGSSAKDYATYDFDLNGVSCVFSLEEERTVAGHIKYYNFKYSGQELDIYVNGQPGTVYKNGCSGNFMFASNGYTLSGSQKEGRFQLSFYTAGYNIQPQ